MKILNTTDHSAKGAWQSLMRLLMVGLSAALFGMRFGLALPSDIVGLCHLCGMSGLVFCLSLELFAGKRVQKVTKVSQTVADKKLSVRVKGERKVAAMVQHERPTPPKTDSVRSRRSSGSQFRWD